MGSVVVSKRSFSLNALPDVHVATDMRPEDSKGVLWRATYFA